MMRSAKREPVKTDQYPIMSNNACQRVPACNAAILLNLNGNVNRSVVTQMLIFKIVFYYFLMLYTSSLVKDSSFFRKTLSPADIRIPNYCVWTFMVLLNEV